MKKIKINRNLAIISPITCLAACTTTEQVVFVTESSLSIANIEAMPAEITVGFDRVEGYFAPAYSNSALPPVVSSIKTDGVNLRQGSNNCMRRVKPQTWWSWMTTPMTKAQILTPS
jgi:hypothetical protein